MKKSIFLAIALMGIAAIAVAQQINWQAFDTAPKNLIYIKAGWDYGMTLGVGYGRKFDTKLPMLANIEYSFPTGENLFDDFKVKVGGQVELLRLGGLSATAKVYCPIRRFENDVVSLFSFGSEFTGIVGYYSRKWYVAGEFGFDKAIATHIKHTAEARETYPDAKDGWYVPTGGNYAYGLQTGFSFGENDLTLRAGKLASQGWKTAPFIPFFAQLGYQRRF